MNTVLNNNGFHFRFKEPGVSSKDTKPAGPDARRLLTDGTTLLELLDVCWPLSVRDAEDAAAVDDLQEQQRATAAAEAAAVAPRHRELVPDEDGAAYTGGLAGSVSASIFDEPEPEPEDADGDEVEDEPEAECDNISDDGDDEDTDYVPAAIQNDDDENIEDDIGDDEALEVAEELDTVGGFRTAIQVFITLALSLEMYCVPFDDSIMENRIHHGTNTQNAIRKWAEAVRAHHPTIMHYYMHQGGAHTLEAYKQVGEPDQTCDTILELGNNRAGRIKRRICWMTKGTISSTKWKQQRWMKHSRAARAAGATGLERRQVERAANQSLTAQLVAAEQFAQICRHRRPQHQEVQPLAALTTGAAGETVKAERKLKDRAQRTKVVGELGALAAK